MYASPSAPAAAREPYAGFTPSAGPAPADVAQLSPSRAASASSGDTIAPPTAQSADGAGAIPASPMQGMLAIFSDFLRAAFEQLGQMLAGFITAAPGGPGGASAAQTAQNAGGPPGDPGSPGPANQMQQPPAGDDGGAQAATPPGGAPAPGVPRRSHHGRPHLHGPQGGVLLPGQRLNLGEGESVSRRRDGSLEITIGGASPTPPGGGPPPDVDSPLLPGGLL